MQLSVCTIAYNEAEWIGACIDQFRPLAARHVVLVSATPWFGRAARDDGTAEIARQAGADVYVQAWPSESEQRNWGLARLYDSDYVLIVDADELYSRSGVGRLSRCLAETREPCFRASEMRTYWKTTDYV